MAWTEWKNMGTKGDVLWTNPNPNPNANFKGTDIDLSTINEYSQVLIEFSRAMGVNYSAGLLINTNENNYIYNIGMGDVNNAGGRRVLLQSTILTISDYTIYHNSTVNNSNLVPTKIIGFKKDITA